MTLLDTAFLYCETLREMPLTPPTLSLMDIKYLSDAKGTITGVFIEIEEWRRLQKQYNIREETPTDSGAQLQQGLAEALSKAKPDKSPD